MGRHKVITELFCEVTKTFSVLVEHESHVQINQATAEQFVDEMTPDDWFRYDSGPPSFDVEVCESSDDLPDTPENQPDIGYEKGRFVALQEKKRGKKAAK